MYKEDHGGDDGLTFIPGKGIGRQRTTPPGRSGTDRNDGGHGSLSAYRDSRRGPEIYK